MNSRRPNQKVGSFDDMPEKDRHDLADMLDAARDVESEAPEPLRPHNISHRDARSGVLERGGGDNPHEQD